MGSNDARLAALMLGSAALPVSAIQARHAAGVEPMVWAQCLRDSKYSMFLIVESRNEP